MDTYTIGNTKACEVLIDRLETVNDSRIQRRVLKIIQKYQKGLKDIQYIPDPRTRTHVRDLWLSHYVAQAATFHEFLVSYIINIMKADYHKYESM